MLLLDTQLLTFVIKIAQAVAASKREVEKRSPLFSTFAFGDFAWFFRLVLSFYTLFLWDAMAPSKA